MCGFAGVLNRDNSINKFDVEEIAKKVSFRGPNNTNVIIYDDSFNNCDFGNNVFFFNRLSILDLENRSNQPFEDDRYTLLFNGEIYNFESLKIELQENGVVFNTTSDTEVLFNLLKLYGTNGISKLNGMFAFVFLDRVNRKLILARDRVGIKPLYYLKTDDSLFFSSEIDSIIRLSDKKQKICKKSVELFLSLQYVPTPYTIWENIHKVPPGHFIELSIDKLSSVQKLTFKPYWNVYDQIKVNPLEKNLESLIYTSIKDQLQSDVPVGFFLSSGIDSSLIAAVVNKHFKSDINFNFFTVAFEQNNSNDESKDAEDFLKAFKNPSFIHHKLILNSENVKNSLLEMYDYIDEPFADYATMLNYEISQKAKKHVTVVLSGDGADELFWGYPRYTQWLNNKASISRKLIYSTLKIVKPFFQRNNLLKKLLNRFNRNSIYSYLNLVSLNPEIIINDKTLWWNEGINELVDRVDLPSVIDFKTYLPDCMCYKIDRSSMGASIEVRVPYLDNEIINYALSQKNELRIDDNFKNKAELKNLLKDIAPHYNFNLPKKGFSLPITEWINFDWKPLIFEYISQKNIEKLDIKLDYKKILDEHYTGKIDHTIIIWRLLSLMIWLKNKELFLWHI